MITGCVACGLVLVSVACIWCAMGGPGAARLRSAVVRARWAWRCHGKPVPGDGDKLTRDETQALGNLAAGRDVRTRT